MTKEELKEIINNIDLDDYHKDDEELYRELYNNTIDYMNDTGDYSMEYLFEDFVDYDTAEEIAKHEMEEGGLVRLYYFLGDANPNYNLFRINGYGNLENAYRDDLRYLKDEILDEIKD